MNTELWNFLKYDYSIHTDDFNVKKSSVLWFYASSTKDLPPLESILVDIA